jgi:demethylmenaquinone methyltransferase/2-methoxy-6-polyprenyl-1,4-benzoquinol methylase
LEGLEVAKEALRPITHFLYNLGTGDSLLNATTPTSPEPAWTDPLLANPHAVADKAARVNKMFSAIAPSYDLNNRLHSMGMDQHWRSVAVKMADVKPTDTIVDVACGTGDLTIKFAKRATKIGGTAPVTGIDFTAAMLPIARDKAIKKLKTPPTFLQGDAMNLQLADKSADILSIAFGIRNVADWGRAIDEFARVLKPGGRLMILEFSLPTNPLLRAFYNFYFKKIMPHTATLISGDKSGAYKYLPQSVNTFISRQDMQTKMRSAGFTNVLAKPLTTGICICYKGTRQ